MAAQFKAPRQRVLNPVEPFSSLTATRESLIKKTMDLKDEIKSKRDENTVLQQQLKSGRQNTQSLVEEVDNLKEESGLTEIQTKGIVVSLADSPAGELTIDSIIHAADLRDIVNLLWSAGATAISINDERMVATTSLDSIVNTVLVNNTRITSPFVIKAAGDSVKLAQVVENQNNLSDLYRRKKNFGIVFNIEKAKEVTIPAFSGSFDIKFANIEL